MWPACWSVCKDVMSSPKDSAGVTGTDALAVQCSAQQTTAALESPHVYQTFWGKKNEKYCYYYLATDDGSLHHFATRTQNGRFFLSNSLRCCQEGHEPWRWCKCRFERKKKEIYRSDAHFETHGRQSKGSSSPVGVRGQTLDRTHKATSPVGVRGEPISRTDKANRSSRCPRTTI